MRTVTICGAVMALTIMTASAASSSQYLCIAENAAGLHYDARSQSWKPQAFKADEKYILRQITADDVKKWDQLLKKREIRNLKLEERRAFDVGDWAFVSFEENSRPLALCVEGYPDLPWVCEPSPWSPLSKFTTDRQRFEMAGGFGMYVGQGYQERLRRDPEKLKREPPGLVFDPSHSDDLFIEIGKCSPF